MRTSSNSVRTARVVGLALGALALSALVVLGAAPTTSGGPRDLSDADVARLGEFTLTDASGVPAISMDQAVQVAGNEYDWAAMPGKPAVESALASVTVAASQGREGAVQGRLVWVVHVSGIEQQVDGPWTPEGPLPGRVLRHAYVFVDAQTGEFLMTSWTE